MVVMASARKRIRDLRKGCIGVMKMLYREVKKTLHIAVLVILTLEEAFVLS